MSKHRFLTRIDCRAFDGSAHVALHLRNNVKVKRSIPMVQHPFHLFKLRGCHLYQGKLPTAIVFAADEVFSCQLGTVIHRDLADDFGSEVAKSGIIDSRFRYSLNAQTSVV